MNSYMPVKLLAPAIVGALMICGSALAQKSVPVEPKAPLDGKAAPVEKPVVLPPVKEGGVVYIPYKDLSAAMDPSARNVLMDRQEFQKLFDEARKNRSGDNMELGQITSADYQVRVQGEKFMFSGELSAVSGSDKPVSVDLSFGQIGITSLTLDGKPAPLGYDKQGRLVLIVTGKGSHKVSVEASAALKELAGGGMQMSMQVPAAVAGAMTVTSPGDLDIHASVPVQESKYDKADDKTTVRLAVGGAGAVTLVLLGNGRQDGEKPILLGESVTSVRMGPEGQNLSCLYSVQILRRGARELQFLLPKTWTVTDVDCPNMVKWSMESAGGDHKLIVRLRAAGRGDQALRIQAVSGKPTEEWAGPYIRLVDAAHERGYLMVDPGDELRIRGEQLADARREDPSACRSQIIIPIGLTGRIYYQWGPSWTVKLGLTAMELRRSVEERQWLIVSRGQIELIGEFRITAVGKEMYDATFILPPAKSGWSLESVSLPGAEAFQYRQTEQEGKNLLKIDFARPVLPEAVQQVKISLKATPEKWDWPAESAGRDISIQLIQSQADTVSGIAAVYPRDDLDASQATAPPMCKVIPVGRMASLGLSAEAQLAWKYETILQGDLKLKIDRRRARLSSGSVGLLSLKPDRLAGDWVVAYEITRASTRDVYLLADKKLGQNLRIDCPQAGITEKKIVPPGPQTLVLDSATAALYNLWKLTLDGQAEGLLRFRVYYEIPLPAGAFEAPLVRPTGVLQTMELLAIEASEELAVDMKSAGAKDIDSIDLPDLPSRAGRILYALQFGSSQDQSASRPAEEAVSVKLSTRIHDNYKIPSSLAVSAKYVTYIDSDAGQRTEANIVLASSAMQFLPVSLPAGAELWSLQINGQPVKPKIDKQNIYLAPMPARQSSVAVRIVYAAPGASGAKLDKLKLAAVKIPGLQMNTVEWLVYPPADYNIVKQDSKMESAGLTAAAPAFVGIYNWTARRLSDDEGGLLMGRRYSRGGMNYFHAAKGGGDTDPASISHSGQEQPEPEIAQKEAIEEENGNLQLKAENTISKRTEITRQSKAAPPVSGGKTLKREGKAGDEDIAKPMEQDQRNTERLPADAPVKGAVISRRLTPVAKEVGRYTLPVDLVAGFGSYSPIRLKGFEADEPVVELASASSFRTLWWIGFIMVAAAGLLRIRRPAGGKAKFIFAVIIASSLLAIWISSLVAFMNGMFFGAIALAIFFPAWALVKRLIPKIAALPWNRKIGAGTAGILLLATIVLAGCGSSGGSDGSVTAGAVDSQGSPVDSETGRTWAAPTGVGQVVIPYQGSPANAEKSSKVLIPYGKYVELWNAAHPDKPLEIKVPAGGIAVAGATYIAKVDEFPSQDAKDDSGKAGRMSITLSMDIQTLGEGWVVLPMPTSGMAISSATLNGKPASLQAGPAGTILMLAPHSSGTVRVEAITTPSYQGLKGSIDFTLPPLPGAVMKVRLPSTDLDLEADGVANVPSPTRTEGATEWTVPLGVQRNVSLRWSPKATIGPADRSLSAAAAHDVYAFNWALVGLSKFQFNFSSGQNDRFSILLPAGSTITDMSGANLRDYQIAGDKVVDGAKFKVAEVRLYRPASKSYELTVRWMADLPELGKPSPVPLPQAGQVAGESGTITLHSAGGMELKIADVTGGRRQGIDRPDNSAGASESQSQVAQYYWPYRPFSLSIILSRLAGKVSCRADQLVRVESDRIQLLCNLKLKATQGRLFGGSFRLGEGYELLSCVGRLVGDWYVQTVGGEKRLHVSLRSAAAEAELALVLLQKEGLSGEKFSAPIIEAIGPDGSPLPDQTGMLAIQVSPSLEAQTLEMSGMKAVPPSKAAGWLKEQRQIQAVQFAYEFEKPGGKLSLKINRLPTKVRSELLAGVNVRTEQVIYTYRIRYDIDGAAIDRVSFTLPSEFAADAAVNCPNMRNLVTAKEADGRTKFTVMLVDEVTGLMDVTVNFAAGVGYQTDRIIVPALRTESPAGIRTIVAVQNSSRHELSAPEAVNLEPMAPTAQKTVLPDDIISSLLAVWQGYKPDWSMTMKFTPAKPALRVQAVVDLMEMTTIIDSTGQSRYQVRVMLQNRSEQFLKVIVPDGLSLWSAFVAGQSVKPVQPAVPETGAILIPLVKTSPGGLPYDIVLYLGGKATNPISGLTRLAPPAIRIADVPVTRTTWSVRLPRDYHYFMQGGNVSSVADKAELMNIEIQALTGQLERMEKSFGDFSGGAMKIAEKNWNYQNSVLSQKREELKEYVSTNRTKLSDQTVSNLNAQIADNEKNQYGMMNAWGQRKKVLQQTANNDLNVRFNQSAQAALAEQVRSGSLNEVPDFVKRAGQAQLEGLMYDIAKPGQPKGAPNTYRPEDGKDKDSGRNILGGVSDESKKAELTDLMKKVQTEQAEQALKNEQQIRKQVSALQDNRMDRYYRDQQANVALAQQGQQGQQQTMGPGGGAGGGGRGAQNQPAQPSVTAGIYNVRNNQGQAGFQQPQEDHKQIVNANEKSDSEINLSDNNMNKLRLRYGFEKSSGEKMDNDGVDVNFAAKYKDSSSSVSSPAGVSTLVPGAVEPAKSYNPSPASRPAEYNRLSLDLTYTSGGEGVYSLAIALPDGGESHNFVCPGGMAELTIWAVPKKLERGFWMTVGVLVAGLVVIVAYRLGRRFIPPEKRKVSLKKPVVYLGTILFMIFLFGISIGIIVGLCIVPVIWFIWRSATKAKRIGA